SMKDPGIANWLDPAGHAQGSIMLRWTGASSGPAPTLSCVAVGDVLQQLGSGARRVTPEERRRSLRARRRAVQMRRRW
ncbi:MAG: hypothetical protein C0457_23025, partial [Polymorphum sp.]|nr:hypothetical protein [Polymorphum sp.]